MNAENARAEGDFRSLLGEDVTPLQGDAPLLLKRAPEITPGTLERRWAAEQLLQRDPNFLRIDDIPLLDPHAELSFLRPGIQYGVFKRLRHGEYRIDARLDLHDHSVEQARLALFHHVRDCLRHDLRVFLVSHGRGEGRKPPALLKSSVAFWLPQLPDVMAFQEGRLSIPEPSAKVAGWPLIGERAYAFWMLASQNVHEALSALEPYLKGVFSWLLGAAAQVGLVLVEAVFAIVISGVTLATAGTGSAGARSFAGRLGDARGGQLVDRATAAVRGVTRGILGVALIQSLLAGLGLLVAGVPAAGLLTVVMLVFCVVQLGVALIMVPAAIWLFANADTPRRWLSRSGRCCCRSTTCSSRC